MSQVSFSSPRAHHLLAAFAVASGLIFSACASVKKTDAPEVVAGQGAMLMYAPSAVNSAEAMAKPYLILVSIDGYRHDYNKLFAPPNLSQLAAEGAQAESLRPVYPSKTFPNHFTLVTGLTADHHGIVSNEFFDPAREATYSLPDRKAVEDGSWYFGEPIWTTAEKQGMLTASYFWVGSEAAIQGGHPNYFYRYDGSVAYEERVDQVLAWLKLPAEKRPHLITLYFEDVDSAAHQYGVGAKETKDAVAKVDRMIGRLRAGIAASGLPVNLVVVSDHGMQDLDKKKIIILDETPEAARVLSHFQAVGRGPQMLLYLNKGENRSLIYEAQKILSKNAKTYRVWRRDQMARFGFFSTPRVGDLIIEPDAPYTVGVRARVPLMAGANHGWDPQKFKTMHGILIANGPAFRAKASLPTVDNVHVYPLLLEVLGLKQRVPIDGLLEPVKGFLSDAKSEK